MASVESKIFADSSEGDFIWIPNCVGRKRMATIGKKLVALAVAAALGGIASSAVAGGFAIGTQSGSGTGNAFAGGAAAADDASVAWFNPAAMTALPTGNNVVGALHFIKPSFKFTNSNSTAPIGSGEGGDGGDWAYIPNAFYATNLGSQWRFGLALNVPFGLKTEYDPGWRGRASAILSDIKTVNINPSVAYKVNDVISIGAGVSFQKIEAELSAYTGLPAAGNLVLNADDTGYGYNVGLMIQASPNTRIGASYRSSIKFEVEGTANFTGTSAALFSSGARAELEVPDSASLSLFHTLGSNWELMGDVTWTGWSTLQQLVVTRTTATGLGQQPGSTITTIPFNWKDTWRYGVGANYKMNNQVKIRTGVALDKTPTNDVDRTPRLPDQDRTWLAFGVQYKPSKTSILDFGYAHEFIKDASINQTTVLGTVSGSFSSKADIFSIQYSLTF
jgi:long-chain fatty acid transport protein